MTLETSPVPSDFVPGKALEDYNKADCEGIKRPFWNEEVKKPSLWTQIANFFKSLGASKAPTISEHTHLVGDSK